MKAVNLIPAEERRGERAGGRTGGAVYGVLGGLAVLVILMGVYVLSGNAIKDREAKLTDLRRQTTAAEQEAAALKPYREYATMRQSRVQTVRQLAASRFDWAPILRKMAQVLPADVYLIGMQGTVAPGVELQDAGGTTGEASNLRKQIESPAVILKGCTRDQAEVARVITRLRLINGVTRVSLASSDKGDKPAGGSGAGSATPAGGGGGTTDCRAGKDIPMFDLVVFFNPVGASATAGATAPPGPATPSPTSQQGAAANASAAAGQPSGQGTAPRGGTP